MRDELELVLAYVPEAEHLSFLDAASLARERDNRAADQFLASCARAECQPVRS